MSARRMNLGSIIPEVRITLLNNHVYDVVRRFYNINVGLYIATLRSGYCPD